MPSWAKKKKLARSCLKDELGMVVHACDSNSMGSIVRRILVQGWLQQKAQIPSAK
jgi:hypothetical protein